VKPGAGGELAVQAVQKVGGNALFHKTNVSDAGAPTGQGMWWQRILM